MNAIPRTGATMPPEEAEKRLISERLADFAHDLSGGAIPSNVRERARHLMLDATGIAYASGRYEFAHKAMTAVAGLGGHGAVPVIGLPARLPPRDAALINGILVHGLDFDDTHTGGVIHATASLWPTVMAGAYARGASGGELVTAYIVGVEAATRLAAVGSGPFHQLGFHPTGLIGVFGCALAAGTLVGLAPKELVMAQGICLSMAAGSLEFLEDGAWTKRLHPGWAAQSGITAAALARAGFVGPSRAYEGRFGLFKAYLQAGIAAERWKCATAGLGAVWETMAVAVKPLPACHFTHAASDAAIVLGKEHKFAIGDIERIKALVPAEVVKTICEPLANKRRPANAYDAQFSLPYLVAASLVRGKFTLAELEPDALGDERIQRLCDLVDYEVDPNSTFPRHYSGEVEIALKDGRRLVRREAMNRGCADRPLSNADIVDKFMGNARMSLSAREADVVRHAVLGLEQARDVRPLIDRICQADPR
ncbi:MAG TPA: MmgE/PrpD family protein [Hyphomicrobiaceae bacterium]|nr:MmgE/PrpD family protein [Hyphomicrobiaceae bacterium]